MVDVNTIVGDAVQAPDGTVIIPISKVSFGFAAGGGEYSGVSKKKGKDEEEDEESGKDSMKFPFAGGSGAGVSISPVAFMVVGQNQIKLLPVNFNTSIEKVLDLIPELVEKANEVLRKKVTLKKEVKNGEVNAKIVKEVENE